MKIGFECKLYRGDPGVHGITATIEVDTVKDTSLLYAAGPIEVKNRTSKYKKYLQGMIDSGIEVSFDFDETDAHCMAFLEASAEKTLLPLYIEFEEPVDAYLGIGLDADFAIFFTNADQPLAELETASFTCKPSAKATREPVFVNDPEPPPAE